MERCRQHFRHDLFGLHVVCNVSHVVDATLQESRSGEEARAPSDDGDVHDPPKNIKRCLVNESMDDGQTPVMGTFQGVGCRFQQMIVPDEHAVEVVAARVFALI